MEQPESDDMSQLMPNLQQQARLTASPGNTAALRQYMKVLGEKTGNVQAASTVPQKPRSDGLALRAGTGRRPQRRYFTIKWKPDDEEAEAREEAEAAEAAALDPEALKDALLEQALAQRRALVNAGLRPGTGRMPRHREFTITFPPPQPEVDEAAVAAAAAEEAAVLAAAEEEAAALAAEEEEAARVAAEEAAAALAAEEEAAALAAEEAAAAAAAAEMDLEQLRSAAASREEEMVAEEGFLAEQAVRAALQPANATPGALMRLQQAQQQEEAERGSGGGATPAEQRQGQDVHEPGSSQRGQGRTPGTSLLGRYTPMEGVPERLALLATRGKGAADGAQDGQRTVNASRLARPPAVTPAGFTPLEGIPERLHGMQMPLSAPRPLALPGATRMNSNLSGRRPSVDSPVEGLVQQGATRSRGSGDGAMQPADAAGQAGADAGGFAGFGLLAAVEAADGAAGAAAAAAEQPAAAAAAGGEDQYDNDDVGGGFDDDGGYMDEDEGAGAGAPCMADAGVQTGASLAGEAAAAAAAAEEAPLEDYGFDGGYDDAGDMHGVGNGHGEEAELEADAGLPEGSAAAAQRAQRRPTKDPGCRLRNEHKRKSLAGDPHIGRQDMAGGRRSSRAKQEPLKWWLNEKLEFGRSHRTMPTVNNVVHKVPNTPWQTVTDIKRRPTKKQRAPSPHDLEQAMAAAGSEGEAAEEEEEEEEAQQGQNDGEDGGAEEQQQEEEEEEPQQQQQPRAGGRRQAAAAKQQAAGPSRRGAAAKAPPARGKATKKKAAGGGSKRKARR